MHRYDLLQQKLLILNAGDLPIYLQLQTFMSYCFIAYNSNIHESSSYFNFIF